jgi:hypothetical protein
VSEPATSLLRIEVAGGLVSSAWPSGSAVPASFSADRRALSEELLRELGDLVADAAP